MERYKLYIVVRTDVEFSRGKLMVHAGHISAELCHHTHWQITDWYCNDQPKIVLNGKDITFIEKLQNKTKELGIIFICVKDAGFYEVEKGTVLMCGIFCTEEQAKELGLKKLRLYK